MADANAPLLSNAPLPYHPRAIWSTDDWRGNLVREIVVEPTEFSWTAPLLRKRTLKCVGIASRFDANMVSATLSRNAEMRRNCASRSRTWERRMSRWLANKKPRVGDAWFLVFNHHFGACLAQIAPAFLGEDCIDCVQVLRRCLNRWTGKINLPPTKSALISEYAD